MATCTVALALRHNRRMRAFPFRWPAVAVLAAGLAACGGQAPAPSAMAPMDGGDGRIEWQAQLPCADCEAIDTRLVLARDGDSRDYVLTETFIAGDGDARFVEHGHWQREDALLRLRGDGGGERVFALLPDGRLEPRDGHGRRFALREGDYLLPVAAGGP